MTLKNGFDDGLGWEPFLLFWERREIITQEGGVWIYQRRTLLTKIHLASPSWFLRWWYD